MPLTKPTASPTSSPVATATGSGPPRASTSAQSTPASATTEPTERSMPPVRMAKLMPAARIAVNAFWRSTFRRLPGVRNESVARPSTRHSAASAMKMP